MSFISDVVTAISLWERYGGAAEKLMSIFDDLEAIDNGRIGDEINVVLTKHGIDVSKLVAAIMPPDTSTSATGTAATPAPEAPSDQQPSAEYTGSTRDGVGGHLMPPGT